MNKYEVMFREMDFCCNRKELVTNPLGNVLFRFIVEAEDIEMAYYEAVKLVRKQTKLLVNLICCILIED